MLNLSNKPCLYYRKALEPGNCIELHECGSANQSQQFEILEILGSGGSVITYKVRFQSAENKYTYILKELYPMQNNVHDILERQDMVLQLDSYKHKEYYNRCRERFKKAYDLQCKMISGMEESSSTLNQATAAPFGLYEDRKSGSDGNYVLYALFRYHIGVVYDMFSHSTFKDLLSTQQQIAAVVSAYHKNGFLWLDIKEKNIYIVGDGSLRSVVMFDFDSLVQRKDLEAYDGFSEATPNFVLAFTPTSDEVRLPPELEQLEESAASITLFKGRDEMTAMVQALGESGVRSDIYLLGSLFFKRLFGHVPTDEEYAALNQQGRLPNCRFLLDYKAKVRNQLRDILKKMLCDDIEKRYSSVRSYMRDLERLIEEIHKSDRGRDHFRAMQQHLYTYPLYETFPKKKNNTDDVRILVAGLGRFGDMFLDIVLQTLQLPDRHLCITVLTAAEEQKRSYLKKRPALADFFSIDDTSLTNEMESYGNIRFISGMPDGNDEESCKKLLSSLYGKNAPHYVMIDTGDDSENRRLAETMCSALGKTKASRCRIGFAVQQESCMENLHPTLSPIYVNHELDRKVSNEMERMAFNVHLVWEKHLENDFQTIYNAFKIPYNYRSNISNILAMKYRLHSIGIKMNEDAPIQAAQKYEKYLNENGDLALQTMMYYEHRRWVVEKLCSGYKFMPPEESKNGKTSDSSTKRHLCLVQSRADCKLHHWPHEKWDKHTRAEFEELDALEQMSVRLHLEYVRRAQKAKNSSNLQNLIEQLQNMVQNDSAVLSKFQEWRTCMLDLWEGSAEIRQQNVAHYKNFRKAFLDAVDASEYLKEYADNIRLNADTLDDSFHPIYHSCLYNDYKNVDIILIKCIPFILTYSSKFCIAVPYTLDKEDNTRRFSNLAAASVINPSKILYFYRCTSERELQEIVDSLEPLSAFMKKKNFWVESIEFIIGYTCVDKAEKAKFRQLFYDKSGGKVKGVTFVMSDREDFPKKLANKIYNKAISYRPYFAIEQKEDYVTGRLYSTGIFDELPSFSFCSATLEFSDLKDCDALRYIHSVPTLLVTDAICFALAKSMTSNKPNFYDTCDKLWEKYRKNSWAWKQLCNKFKVYAKGDGKEKGADRIAEFYHGKICTNIQTISINIQPKHKKAWSKILTVLKKQNIIEAGSNISNISFVQEQVIIFTSYPIKKICEDLQDKLNGCQNLEAVECEIDEKNHKVYVNYDSLEVFGVEINDNKMKDLLNFFKDNSYIQCLREDTSNNKYSFRYASPQIKQLLTMEGRILEIYVYHKLRAYADENGERFDDIRSGFEIIWKDEVGKSELDCIVTKGLSMAFIECKARTEIKTEFYPRIASLTRKFGINALAVLIIEAESTSDFNRKQAQLGNEYNVITILKDDIEKIDEILFEKLSGK